MDKKQVLKATTLCLILTILSFSPAYPQTKLIPPNGYLEVAYRQLTDGKLSDSIHNLSLSCLDGNCSLTTLTVNQCFNNSVQEVAYPKVQRTSTREGDLIIDSVGNDSLILIEKEQYGDTTLTYKFYYSSEVNPGLSKQAGLKNNIWFERLTNFSGGALKDSALLKKIITWDLVPLKGEWVTIKPKCDMIFKGIP